MHPSNPGMERDVGMAAGISRLAAGLGSEEAPGACGVYWERSRIAADKR